MGKGLDIVVVLSLGQMMNVKSKIPTQNTVVILIEKGWPKAQDSHLVGSEEGRCTLLTSLSGVTVCRF